MHRRSAAAPAAAAAVATLAALALPAWAAGGTWGAGHYRYSDGVVCTSGGLTSPLASWDFGDPAPDFLATAVVSNGVQDSAQLPEQNVPGRFSTPVGVGQAGFTSVADIATYAQLIARDGGTSAATVARAVLDHSDPGRAPSCVSAGAAAALVAAAARSAGPYAITLTAASPTLQPGTPDHLTVRVSGGSGGPAAGVAVTLNADAAVFAGSSSRTVTTGGDGTASAPLTAPPGFTATSVNVQATASASVGLELVSVVAGAGQQYAEALYADPPQTYTGQLTVQVDETAHPVLSLGAGGTGGTPGVAGVVGVAVPLSLTVTGMHGHSGQAQLEAVGPAPLDATRLCAGGVPTGDNAAAYTSPVLTVTGDQSVSANDWLPDKPGCYRLRAQLVTTDAVPQAKAVSPAVVVTVLDSTATFRATRTVIGSGPFAGTLAQAHTHGLSGTAQVQVRGPAAPRSGDCSAVDWSRVPAHVIARFPVQGDRSYQVISAPVTTPGCYRLAGVVGLAVPGGATAAVPLQISGDGAVFVLRPAVTVTADQPWSVSPAAVGAHVTVSGTYGQAGTLRIAMVRVPAGPMGCRGVDLSAATTVDTGPSVPFTGDGTYAVRSGRTPQNGCYGLVPTLRMDVNTAITATARPGLDAIVLAGLSPAIVAAGDNPPARPLEAPRALTVWPAAAIYLVLFLAVAAVTGKVANDARHVERRPAPGLDLLD